MKIFNKINIGLAAIAAAGLSVLPGCKEEYDGFKMWENIETPTPEMKPRYIWVDASANFPDFANSRDNIVRDLTLAKNSGFTDVVVDVRGTTGDILFKSSHCPEVKSMNAWSGGEYKTFYRTETWDYLQAFIDEGHKLGMRIHAGFNTMVGGTLNGGVDQAPAGILFRDNSKKEWATYRYNGGNPVNVMETGEREKFFNPCHPEVQTYLCNLLTDLAKYNLDGIILDRGRYNDLYSDFSPESRRQFEEYIGVKLSKFPGDILPAGSTETTLGSNYGPYTTKWLEFRAKTIYDFMAKAREAVKGVNPDVKFGVYVGAWYSSYYNTGVNWASKTYDPSRTAKWASTRYKNYGYAELMDQILLGAYAAPTQVYGSGEWTMAGFCSQGKAKIGKQTLVVGGPNVDWDFDGKYTKAQILDGITNSVPACIDACDGYFLFDMIHLKLAPEKWDAVKKGADKYVADWNATYGPKE